ncbi:MAG: choice-of-anchor D domain-containing protein [Deltaproteobacteria bacterium]|nr:choice-of-anchor D domain-containing protein [Deltaproteobacteria bacterium]
MGASRPIAAAWLLALAAACNPSGTTDECDGGTACPGAEDTPPRLFITPPFGLGFDCVTTQCDTTQHLSIENRGSGVVRLTRVALTSTSSEDFTVTLQGAVPLEIRKGTPVRLDVRYVPTDSVADDGQVRITYQLDPPQGPDPEPVTVALRTRTLGSPHAKVEPPELNFGYVAPGDALTIPIRVKNDTLAPSVLAVTAWEPEPESDPAFRVLTAPPLYVNTAGEALINVKFAPALDPSSARTFRGRLHLATNDGANPDIPVDLIATAKMDAELEVLLPGNVLEVGSIGVGGTLSASVRLRNVGGRDLTVAPSLEGAEGAGFSIQPAAGALPPIASFEYDQVVVNWTAVAGGQALGPGASVPYLVLRSNDPRRAVVRIRLDAFGVLPTCTPNPAQLDFGGVVVGWTTEPRTVGVRNTGAGPLHITAVSMEPGSSVQIQLEPVSALPVTLLPEDPPMDITLRYLPASEGTVNGTLIIVSDDPNEPLKRVPVRARGMNCTEGCPIPHATPTCLGGKCDIDACEPGWHDTDHVGVNGCECGEDDGGDIGQACGNGGARNAGTFKDSDGREAYLSGVLSTAEDEDWWWFFAEDDGGVGELFGDSFDLRVEMTGSTPAGLEFCVRHDVHDVQGQGCGRGGETCGLRSFRRDGSWGSEDGRDVTLRVRFTPGTGPFCGNYSIRVKNG